MRKRVDNKRPVSQRHQENDFNKPKGNHNSIKDSIKIICKYSLWSIFICLLLYSFAAVTFIYCTWIQREIVYVNRINIPFFANLSNPKDFGLHTAKNFYLQHVNQCRIGVWYVPPGKYANVTNVTSSLLSDGSPIILYLHGNTGARATSARVGLYKYLSEKNYHVVTFDYRGFGDSDCHPSETNIMEDGLLVWQWIKLHAPEGRIYLWGHSLGSGATTHLTVHLQSIGDSPVAILLDAPFTDIHEAAYNHPLGLPFRPLGKRFFLSIRENHSSIERISQISCPIMIMHGHMDVIIPFHIGKKLYEAAVHSQHYVGQVIFIDCGQANHKYNYHSDELKKALDVFIK